MNMLMKNSFSHSLYFKSNRDSWFNPTIFLSKRVVIPTERCHYLYRKVSSFIKEGTSNGKASSFLLNDAFIPMERRRYPYRKVVLFLPEDIFIHTKNCPWLPANFPNRFIFLADLFIVEERQGKKPSLSIGRNKTIKPFLLLKFCDNLDIF